MPSAEAQRKAGSAAEGRKLSQKAESAAEGRKSNGSRGQTESGNILTYRSAAG